MQREWKRAHAPQLLLKWVGNIMSKAGRRIIRSARDGGLLSQYYLVIAGKMHISIGNRADRIN